MSLNNNEPNPLSTIKARRLKFLPAHFTEYVSFNVAGINFQILDQWINYNLNSRYACAKTYAINESGVMSEAVKIGFEDPSEITIFLLGCPHIKK